MHPDKKIDKTAVKVLMAILKESESRHQKIKAAVIAGDAAMRQAMITIDAMNAALAAELAMQKAIKKTLARAKN